MEGGCVAAPGNGSGSGRCCPGGDLGLVVVGGITSVLVIMELRHITAQLAAF